MPAPSVELLYLAALCAKFLKKVRGRDLLLLGSWLPRAYTYCLSPRGGVCSSTLYALALHPFSLLDSVEPETEVLRHRATFWPGSVLSDPHTSDPPGRHPLYRDLNLEESPHASTPPFIFPLCSLSSLQTHISFTCLDFLIFINAPYLLFVSHFPSPVFFLCLSVLLVWSPPLVTFSHLSSPLSASFLLLVFNPS